MAVTVQVSRLRTGSPSLVTSRRSLRRVATTSQMWTASPAAIRDATSASRSPASRRAGLDGVVDGVDVVVRRGDDCDAAAGVVVVDPGGGDAGEVVGEGAGDDAAVGLVGVEGDGVTASQLQGCGGFPGVGEAVETFELVDAAVGAQLGEQATRPTPCNCRGSPTSARRHPFRPARVTTWWRPGVDSIPASSTISVAPGGSWYSGCGGRSVRWCSWSSLATVSARMPVSRSTVRAALAVGATANTTRPFAGAGRGRRR